MIIHRCDPSCRLILSLSRARSLSVSLFVRCLLLVESQRLDVELQLSPLRHELQGAQHLCYLLRRISFFTE